MAHLQTIEPAAWLADFAAVGGGYTVTPDGRLILGFVLLGRTDTEQREAARMLEHLGKGGWSALRSHLVGRA